jgi:phosphoribosyl-ATP pyrophosphohydrolase
MMSEPFQDLMAVLQQRKASPSPDSYTARLLAQGEDEIVKKIGEEAIEIILAAKGQGDERLLEETADLIYHLSVLLVARGLDWSDVVQVLVNRSG